MEKVRWIQLGFLVLAAALMGLAVLVNGARMSWYAISTASIVEGKEFSISYLNYNIDNNILKIEYGLRELAGKSQEMKVVYGLRDLDGNKIGQGEQDVVLGAGESGDFRASMDLPKDAIGAFRLSFSVWNGEESRWVVRDIGRDDTSISTMSVMEQSDRAGNWILALLILTFVCLLIVLYLQRHNARARAFEPEKRKLIAFDLG